MTMEGKKYECNDISGFSCLFILLNYLIKRLNMKYNTLAHLILAQKNHSNVHMVLNHSLKLACLNHGNNSEIISLSQHEMHQTL